MYEERKRGEKSGSENSTGKGVRNDVRNGGGKERNPLT